MTLTELYNELLNQRDTYLANGDISLDRLESMDALLDEFDKKLNGPGVEE